MKNKTVNAPPRFLASGLQYSALDLARARKRELDSKLFSYNATTGTLTSEASTLGDFLSGLDRYSLGVVIKSHKTGMCETFKFSEYLMVAYAESLPVFADSCAVSRLAVDMVEVSKLRTVVDLWVTAETA